MRYEDWNNGLNGLDVSLIENHLAEKDKYKKKRKTRSLTVRISAAAACVAIIFTSIIVPIKMIDPSPVYESVSYTAEDIARVMKSIATYGKTNAYTKVYVPDSKYLYIEPISKFKKKVYIYEYQNLEAPTINMAKFNMLATDIFTTVSNNLGNGDTSFEYEIDYNAKFKIYNTGTVIAGINTGVTYGEKSTLVDLRPSDSDVGLSLNGNKIKIDQNLSDKEILKLLDPVKDLLFKTFNVNFSKATVIRNFDKVEDGALSITVRFYDMPKDLEPLGKISDYIEIKFSNDISDITNKDIFEIYNIYYRKGAYPVEQRYTIKAENKLIPISEAEELLYKGYVFGGHSCRLCMEAQDKISFEDYDFVEIEYIFDMEYSGIYAVQTVAIPFYAFYKEIGTAENGNIIYAKTYVPAVEVSGLDEYFEGQIKNHK